MLKKIIRKLLLHSRYPKAVISSSAAIDRVSQIGNYVAIFNNVKILHSSIARYTYLQENSFVFNAEIGAFCSIGANTSIGLVNHPIDSVCTSPVFYDNSQPLPKFFTQVSSTKKQYKKTIISSDVWIGDGVKIIEGVEIGVGAVIGAGSIVTKNIPPYAIAAGNPCRVIRNRFSEATCTALLASNWWGLSDEKLQNLTPFFHDPDFLLKELRKL